MNITQQNVVVKKKAFTLSLGQWNKSKMTVEETSVIEGEHEPEKHLRFFFSAPRVVRKELRKGPGLPFDKGVCKISTVQKNIEIQKT